ncbi:nucleotidyltransferase family protein [Magnetospirillum moscoviense]|uniref:Mannose-1-phosphate guanylyltransferase n=1 Tax=Magnetospirillum moscoviense TaxID=1437059 RepID=A0A178MV35_9PROT|nr:nucleotidyltransferase family protein [Magnetospirillum moscoviense]MBF0325289.1 nucleotidyltransferase family protein [Alphaproteobacteria bacterium]OAN54012.1 mannose-1-phosphate guanylyltransferase [Magnetospirillum moscoviense]
MSTRPTHGMVLAAGLGLRMRPITLTIPKPLVAVAGRTMLDRALDHLGAAEVGHLVVNTHWLPHCIEAHLAGRPNISLSPETELLETGGGVARALPLLGEAPFYVVNSDIIWTDGAVSALTRLAQAWDDARMDALLLLVPTARAVGYDGPGDFFIDANGVPWRRRGQEVAPTLFSGVQILHPRLFGGCPSGKFSLNVLYDRALEDGRLFGLLHDGRWYHVGTPEALPAVEAALIEQEPE